jgi:CCR4-NOT transcription complex subunit 7/8
MTDMTPKKTKENNENSVLLSPSRASNPEAEENQRSELEIIDVWEDNFEEEMDKIQELLEKYNYVAMDTEFPGVYFQGDNITGYSLIKTNVDQLKLIQVGITLADENGNTPQPISTWQFNLRFDLKSDLYSPDSISMLKEAGINFEQMAERGIDPIMFADGFLCSGLMLTGDIHWITFHGAFDFAYLMRVISNTLLPGTLEKFKSTMKVYFPSVADIKVLMKEVHDLKSGALSKLARDLDLKRIGTSHQAGSDAEITLRCFFKLKAEYFKDGISPKLLNKVFGLSNEYQNSQAPATNPPKPTPQDIQRMNMYPQYATQPIGYYPYPGGDFQQGFYYNQIEMPMMYSAMQGTDFSNGFKL